MHCVVYIMYWWTQKIFILFKYLFIFIYFFYRAVTTLDIVFGDRQTTHFAHKHRSVLVLQSSLLVNWTPMSYVKSSCVPKVDHHIFASLDQKQSLQFLHDIWPKGSWSRSIESRQWCFLENRYLTKYFPLHILFCNNSTTTLRFKCWIAEVIYGKAQNCFLLNLLFWPFNKPTDNVLLLLLLCCYCFNANSTIDIFLSISDARNQQCQLWGKKRINNCPKLGYIL